MAISTYVFLTLSYLLYKDGTPVETEKYKGELRRK